MKLKFVWSSSARAELRRVDRETAMRILLALTRYAQTGEGDVKALEGSSLVHTGFESETGEFGSRESKAALFGCVAVENRGEAY